MPQEIIDYAYDDKNQLIKIKTRDSKGKIISDGGSNYTKYEYDNKGRKIKETTQYYYGNSGPETTTHLSTFRYNDDKLERDSKTFINEKIFITAKTHYDERWKPLKVNEFNNLSNEAVATTTYQYDSFERLIEYRTMAGRGGASECPDGGTYRDTYYYNGEGLISQIKYSYENIECLMTFEYR
jgi:hypothetical protein